MSIDLHVCVRVAMGKLFVTLSSMYTFVHSPVYDIDSSESI